MEIVEKKVTFNFSSDEREALETVAKLFAEIADYCLYADALVTFSEPVNYDYAEDFDEDDFTVIENVCSSLLHNTFDIYHDDTT